MEEEPEILGNQDFRRSIWQLLRKIVFDKAEWSKNTRLHAVWLLRDGVGAGNDLFEHFLEDDALVKELIFTFLEDPDPDPESDRPPEGYAGHNDPSHTALNTVRPVALDALIMYILRKSNEDQSVLDHQISDKLEEKLEDISLGVHSVFGRRLISLWKVDKEWVIDHLPEIFPRSQGTKDIDKFTAAWDSYVAFNSAYSNVFKELRKYYFHAIDLVADDENTETINADQQLARHLVANYLYEYELEEWSDSLLFYLFDRGDTNLARQVASSLWMWGNEQEETDVIEKWDKIRSLWERRIKQVREDKTYSDEIIWYMRWLEHVEGGVELSEIDGLVRNSLTHIENSGHRRLVWSNLEEYLSVQASDHTKTAVELFYELTMNFERPFTQDFNEDVEAILRPAFEKFKRGDEVYEKAFEIAQDYASDNDKQAQGFLDEVTDIN